MSPPAAASPSTSCFGRCAISSVEQLSRRMSTPAPETCAIRRPTFPRPNESLATSQSCHSKTGCGRPSSGTAPRPRSRKLYTEKMRRAILITIVLLALSLRGSAATPHLIWFCPGPGTLDYIRLFEHPEEWRRARDLVDVFKFYQQHTQPTNLAFAPNTYAALANANAFRMVKSWGKKLALELGVVKDFVCADPLGTQHVIENSIASVRAVEAAGGKVDFLSMDDPLGGGKPAVCGGPAIEPTVDRIAAWVHGVEGVVPRQGIGMIEAYPLTSADDIERALLLLRDRGALPGFLHMDVDINAVRPPASDFTRDIPRLRDFAHAQGMQFGVLIFGSNPDVDALYALDAERLVNAIGAAFTDWNDMPDHIIIQSFAQTRSGLWITPSNLPEDRPYTHTTMIRDIYRRLRGQTGAASGTAIRR